MTLLTCKHHDDASAALSIAANRASKIRLLLDAADLADEEGDTEGDDRMQDIARRLLDSLEADVENFLRSARFRRVRQGNPDRAKLLRRELRQIVTAERACFPVRAEA